MTARLKPLVILFVAVILGTLYAALIGLITYPLRACLISWPIWIILFGFVIWKYELFRFIGFFAVLPISILTFEIVRTLTQPAIYAFQYLSLDRSHYKPDMLINRRTVVSKSEDAEDTPETV